MLGGVVPFEFDDLTIAEIGPDRRFLERSTMAAYSVWVHERSVEATPVGCVLRDRVSFVLRRPLRWLPGLAHVHQAVVTRIFRHRHRRLVDRFGGQSALAGPPT